MRSSAFPFHAPSWPLSSRPTFSKKIHVVLAVAHARACIEMSSQLALLSLRFCTAIVHDFPGCTNLNDKPICHDHATGQASTCCITPARNVHILFRGHKVVPSWTVEGFSDACSLTTDQTKIYRVNKLPAPAQGSIAFGPRERSNPHHRVVEECTVSFVAVPWCCRLLYFYGCALVCPCVWHHGEEVRRHRTTCFDNGHAHSRVGKGSRTLCSACGVSFLAPSQNVHMLMASIAKAGSIEGLRGPPKPCGHPEA